MRKKYTKTYHIVFDSFGVDRKLLTNERFILDLLLGIPKLIGMKILAGPNIVRDYDSRKPGITGFAIISYSHISIHSFVKTREIFIDIFSCRKFDYAKTRRYLYKKLRVRSEDVETVEVRYPWE